MAGLVTDALLPVLAVTGLAREARIAAGPGVVTMCGGGDSGRLRRMLRGHHGRYRAVISFGLAGGLDPALTPGDVVLSTHIVHDGARYPTHGSLSARLGERLARARTRILHADTVGSETLALEPVHKAALHARTGAIAVDMESHVAAAFAASHGLPLAVIRVICDATHRRLPTLATHALRPDGRIDLPVVVRRLAREPHQLPALLRTARDSAAAFASLRRCRRLLGVGFALSDPSGPGLDFADFGELLGDVA